MRIRELEELFKDEKTVDLVLQDLEKDMEIVEKWLDYSLSDINDNAEELKKAINELSVAYGHLRVVLGIAETEYRNREVRYYAEAKIKAEAESKKFVSAQTDREASLHVAEYRRIRNIVQAYESGCSRRITVLQSILKTTLIEQQSNPSTE